MLEGFAKILPGKIRKKYKALLGYCDIALDADVFIGSIIGFGIIVAIIVATNLSVLFSFEFSSFTIFLSFLITFVLFQFMIYMWLVLRADGKAKFVENILPDVLMLMAMNIRSGMTTDRALIMTARPEFGLLEKELNRAGKQVLAGKEIKYALLEMTQHIRSKTLESTVRMIIEGIESGGELSSLLQQTADEIQNSKIIQGEVRANVLMYAIFIFFAAGIGAPLLFGISTYIVSNISQQFATFHVSGMGQQATRAAFVSPGFLTTFAMAALAVTSLFGGLIVGIVKNGEEKSGVKFIPILLIISFAVFFAVKVGLGSVFPSFS
ncbi:MAG: type II secretion system F family protein [Candidatus Aenigmarchaeota archaeon]|nr:type II secretion system F family protein [Candidatus Aenigmarchaeota archaeon]